MDPFSSFCHSSFVTAFYFAAFSLVAADLHDPDFELRSLKVAEGYQVNLFAAEPKVVKPMQMTFDPQGRLWVICSPTYPQIEPGEQPRDKIVVLEDTDGDGVADKTTDFATGLMVPTGLALGNRGVYVGQGTELLHLMDTDGDGKADLTRVVLSGFGTGDNHQDINSFIWSPGGELFFHQGHNIRSRIETASGIVSLNRAGVWRFRPRTLELDSFFNESNGPLNPWGTVFDHWGRPITVDGCCMGIFDLLPAMVNSKPTERYFELWLGKKVCGADWMTGPHWPDDAQGVLVGGTFYQNMVSRFRLTEEGAGFTAKELPPLIETTNRFFRVVDVKAGPDGAMYLADWYNPIVGHYQYSFRHPDRDKTHGRIWRVTAKNRALHERTKLVDVPVEQLLEQLKSPIHYNRYQAKRVLSDFPYFSGGQIQRAEIGDPVIAATWDWIKWLDANDANFEHSMLEALGIYETHEFVEPELLKKLLRAHDPRVRAYATRVVERWHTRLDEPLKLLETQVKDEHPRVRLEAVVALSYFADAGAMEIAALAVDQPMDKFLDFALRQAVQALKPYWGPAFAAGKINFDNNQKRLEFVLKADGTADSIRPVMALLKSESLVPATRENFLNLIANVGGPEELATVFDAKTYISAAGYDAKLHAKILSALAAAQRVRKVRPTGELIAPLTSLIENSDESLRAEALKLAGAWKLEALRPTVAKFAEAKASSERVRRGAIESLGLLGGESSQELLWRLSETTQPEKIRLFAAIAMTQKDIIAAASRAAELLSLTPSSTDPTELFSAFLQRTGGAEALAEALNHKQPSSDSAKLGLRLMSSVGRQDARLVRVLNEAAGLHGEVKQLTPDELKALIAEVRANGDARRGDEIFRRPETSCTACHSIGGLGDKIGPDLSAIGSGQPLDFIIGAVLHPNKEIKEGYLSTEVTTKDGEVHQGYKLRESKQELVLRDVLQNDEIHIRADNIKTRRELGSLMPTGLVDQLTRAEFRDLLRFLSELGTPVRQE